MSDAAKLAPRPAAGRWFVTDLIYHDNVADLSWKFFTTLSSRPTVVMIERTHWTQTSANAKILRGKFFTGEDYRLLVWPRNVLQGHRGWCHGQNTYDFLLVFYSYVGRIPYRFCATVDFMRKWPCWATVTSKWQWRSIHITPKMKSLGQDLPHVNSCITFYVRQTEW